MKYIPGTQIEDTAGNVEVCLAPKGKYRTVCMDTMTGDHTLVVLSDLTKLEEAQECARMATGGPVSQEGGPMVNKAYVFDDELKCVYEEG